MTEEESIKTFKSWLEYNKKHKNILREADKIIEVQETILNLIQKLQEENRRIKKEYYCLINRIEDRIDKFDHEFNKAKRKNDNDRADYYWDLIINFKKLLESEEINNEK